MAAPQSAFPSAFPHPRHLIHFDTRPQGAQVVANGRWLCTTPCADSLEESSTTIRVRMASYEGIEEQQTIDHSTHGFFWDLKPQTMPLSLDVLDSSGAPVHAMVLLDGSPLGPSPLWNVPVRLTAHRLEVEGYPQTQTEIKLQAGRSLHLGMKIGQPTSIAELSSMRHVQANCHQGRCLNLWITSRPVSQERPQKQSFYDIRRNHWDREEMALDSSEQAQYCKRFGWRLPSPSEQRILDPEFDSRSKSFRCAWP